jgi:hypothetical protein
VSPKRVRAAAGLFLRRIAFAPPDVAPVPAHHPFDLPAVRTLGERALRSLLG